MPFSLYAIGTPPLSRNRICALFIKNLWSSLFESTGSNWMTDVKHINLLGLFNAKSTLSERQKWYYLTHWWESKWVHAFPKGICPKVNVVARLEFELAYYDSSAKRLRSWIESTHSFFCQIYLGRGDIYSLLPPGRIWLKVIFIGDLGEWGRSDTSRNTYAAGQRWS